MITTSATPKMEMLLRPSDSKVGVCFQALLGLLREWSIGGAKRRPWCLLDVVGAPVDDERFQRWVRSQVLRLASALFRRYESRLATWPYKLFALVCPEFSGEERDAVIASLLGAKKESLDCDSLGIRRLYPTTEALQSQGCISTLAGDFRNHSHNMAQVERLNAELTRMHNPRALAKSFPAMASHSVLKQAEAVHRGRGGDPALAPRALEKQRPMEKLCCHTLMLPLVGDIGPTRPQAGAITTTDIGGDESAAGPPGASGSTAIVARPEVLALASTSGPAMLEAFGPPVAFERSNPALLVAPRAATDVGQPVKRVGLNPYMMEKNKFMATAKRTLGRAMTPTEVRQATEDFKAFWASMDHDVVRDAYADWRETPQAEGGALEDDAYTPSWGGGCRATPVTKDEFHQYLKEFGWPSDQDLQQRRSKKSAEVDADADFNDFAGHDIWGIGRWPRNVDRTLVNTAVQLDRARLVQLDRAPWQGEGRLRGLDADGFWQVAAVGGGHRTQHLPRFWYHLFAEGVGGHSFAL